MCPTLLKSGADVEGFRVPLPSNINSSDGEPYFLTQAQLEATDASVRSDGGRLLKVVRDTPISTITSWEHEEPGVHFSYVNRLVYISGYTFNESCLISIK